jgi:hypothetical protein
VDNCQASVALGLVNEEGYAILDIDLYLQKKWFEDDFAEMRKKCQVPEGLEFRTKNQLAMAMLEKAVTSGLFGGIKYVGVDCAFGRDHVFLDSLPKGLIYFADVPCDQRVFAGLPDMVVPEYAGRGRRPGESPSFPPTTVRAIIEDPGIPWEDVVQGMGAKGPVIVKDKLVKVYEVRDGKPGKPVWLYARRMEDKTIKYALCNESMDATPAMVRTPALMRWTIEQCFNECKDYLGMDHYETRSWIGWRRHMLITFIAHLFITKLRRRFALKMDSPGPAPHPLVPVTVEEYGSALRRIRNGQAIENPKILAFPELPQQVLTIGLIQLLLNPLLAKTWDIFETIEHALQEMASAFASSCRSKNDQIIEMTSGLR